MKFRILTVSLFAIGLLLPAAAFAASPRIKKAECYKVYLPTDAEKGVMMTLPLKKAGVTVGDTILCVAEVIVPKRDRLDNPDKDLKAVGQLAVKQAFGDKEKKTSKQKFSQVVSAGFDGHMYFMVKLGEKFDPCKKFTLTISAWGKAKDMNFKAPGGNCK